MDNNFLEEAKKYENTNVVLNESNEEEDIITLYDDINRLLPFIKKSGNKKMLDAAKLLSQEIYRDWT